MPFKNYMCRINKRYSVREMPFSLYDFSPTIVLNRLHIYGTDDRKLMTEIGYNPKRSYNLCQDVLMYTFRFGFYYHVRLDTNSIFTS